LMTRRSWRTAPRHHTTSQLIRMPRQVFSRGRYRAVETRMAGSGPATESDVAGDTNSNHCGRNVEERSDADGEVVDGPRRPGNVAAPSPTSVSATAKAYRNAFRSQSTRCRCRPRGTRGSRSQRARVPGSTDNMLASLSWEMPLTCLHLTGLDQSPVAPDAGHIRGIGRCPAIDEASDCCGSRAGS
jgi:hypothetical protein